AHGERVGRAAPERAARRRACPRSLPRAAPQPAPRAGRRLRRAPQRPARPARPGRSAAAVGRRARRRLGRCELQGRPAAQPPHRPARRARGRRLRQEGHVPRHDRGPRRRHRRGVRAPAGAKRDRQLDQDRAARAGPDRARPEGSARASAARRPLDGREGRRRRHQRPCSRGTDRASRACADERLRPRQRRGRRRGAEDHRRQPRPPRRRRATGNARDRARRGADDRPHGVDRRPLMATASIAAPARRPAPAAAPATPESGPLQGAELVLGTIALSLATFMNVLDSSIANVSIPAISGDLGVSPSQGTWVITSFAVANAISVPLTGWLTQRFGPVRLFVMSILLFVVASWLCGLAPNIGMLIAFRVLQGFVAGPMIPLSQTLLLASYPRAKSGTAMAMWAMTVLVAPVAGPLLGGWITDNISWPWIFYINIPVGLAAAAVTWSIYRKRDAGG